MDDSGIEIHRSFYYPKQDIMRRLGVHTSIAEGLPLSLERAIWPRMQRPPDFFSQPPIMVREAYFRRGAVSFFRSLRVHLDISPVYIHASYLINVASGDPVLRRKSVDLLSVELARADTIGADYVILHTGSASGEDGGIARKRAISV